jgi:SAM-dependent methyltransferase
MFNAAPEMMSRKIGAANVQQAWVLNTVRMTNAMTVLCVGSFEDTALETLRAHDPHLHLTAIDPALNYSLHDFQKHNRDTFECVFSTSVIEHVPDDEQFVRDLCDCLTVDGVCILTADYRADWKPGDPLPATDVRLYTPADIERLGRVLESKGCYWIDQPDLAGAPDFHYQGHDYSFVALVFKKL